MLSGFIAIVVGTVFLFKSNLELNGLNEGDGPPGILLIEAVDTYLFSFVILVLGGGIFKLFVGDENTFKGSVVFSKIKTFMDLKVLLREALLLTLKAWCALGFFAHPKDLQFEKLILPITIVLLAFAKGLYIPLEAEVFVNLKKVDRFNDLLRISTAIGYRLESDLRFELYPIFNSTKNITETNNNSSDFILRCRVFQGNSKKQELNINEEDGF
jgi:hypothetical protein